MPEWRVANVMSQTRGLHKVPVRTLASCFPVEAICKGPANLSYFEAVRQPVGEISVLPSGDNLRFAL